MLKNGTGHYAFLLIFSWLFFIHGGKGGAPLTCQVLDINFHHLTEKDGLLPSEHYHIFKDSKKEMWIGTENGLLRFNGQSFHQATKQTGEVFTEEITSRCFEGPRRNLWFTTPGALYSLHLESGFTSSYQVPKIKGQYQAIYQTEEGNIWLRIGDHSGGYLVKFSLVEKKFSSTISLVGKSIFPFPSYQGQVNEIVQLELPDAYGLLVTNLNTEQSESIEFIYTHSGEERALASPSRGCYIDKKGNIWTGDYDGIGFYSLAEKKSWVIRDRSPEILYDIGFVRDIAEYKEHYLLIAADQGLFVLDRRIKKIVRQFQPSENLPLSLPFKSLTNIYVDDDDHIWLAGKNGEIAFTTGDKQKFSHLSQVGNLGITSMQRNTEGQIWCSTSDRGSYLLSSRRTILLQTEQIHLPAYPKEQVALPRINFFLGSNQIARWGIMDNQFARWVPEQSQFEFREQNFLGVYGAIETSVNYALNRKMYSPLIAFGRKLYQLDLKGPYIDTLPYYNTSHLNLAPITFLGETKQSQLLIGDQKGRLVVLKEQGHLLTVISDQSGLGKIHTLTHDSIRQLYYLATSKGLAQLNPETFELSWFTQEDHNLPQETYYNAIPDEFGNLWLPGNNGLIRYHPETKAFHRFTTADGLLSNVFVRNASLRVPETGEIWLGSKNGVNVFYPKDITLSDFKPNISISELLVNDNPFEPEREENKGNLNEKKSLTFNYQDNTLSFRFVALDYSDPEANEYYYQMEGYDEERVYAGTRNFVRYPNLPAGDYTLKIWATNSDKVLNEIPKVLSLIIIPPIYQRWWFYLLCLIVVSAIMYAIFQYRLEQALKVERLRVKISSDLHDDVGGMLSGLAMQTELLELTANEERKPKLARVAEMSRSAMSRMRDTVWAIDARKDTLADLVDRMREHAEETLSPRNIQYSINVTRLEMERVLTTDVRQSLYLIYKEAVTNAAKHSTGDTLNVDLTYGDAGFIMSIHDNGTVTAKDYKTTGAGLSNMHMRAASIGASLSVTTDSGYQILLRRKSL